MRVVRKSGSAIGAMCSVLALTLVALVVPRVDHATRNVAADHIRAGYLTYTRARIDTAVSGDTGLSPLLGRVGTLPCLAAAPRWTTA